MSRRQHANLARDLLTEFKTLDDAARQCRVSRARLADYANEFTDQARYMPADVIADLEAACGKPIYSAALLAALSKPQPTETLENALCDLTYEAAELMNDGRHGLPTPRARAHLAADARALMRKAEEILELIDAENEPTRLKAV